MKKMFYPIALICAIIFAAVSVSASASTGDSVTLPILMYHSFTDDADAVSYTTVYSEDLRTQLAALTEDGYTPVLYRDIINYVRRGGTLPERPILITFDDGYRNNLDIAAPILEEYGACASISVIGCSCGKSQYKNTDTDIIPHFALSDASEYVARGVLELKSHSFDMHQSEGLDGALCRHGAVRRADEHISAYVHTLWEDWYRMSVLLGTVPGTVNDVYTYPYGSCDMLSEAVLKSIGYAATVTTESGINVISRGDPESLYMLRRVTVPGGMSADRLMRTLRELSGEK